MVKNLFLIFTFISGMAQALPIAERHYLDNVQFLDTVDTSYNFEGIIALNNCSGSLVRYTRSGADDRAMVLTNGHCLANMFGGGMPEPGVVHFNKSASRSIYILDASSGQKKGTVRATKILYATMTGTDMMLYQLDKTYNEIEAEFGIKPLTLAESYVGIGDEIQIISGYWKKGYTCKADKIVYSLKEADWLMFDSIRYSQPGCETIGGTSGSPIVSAKTGEVVGVNNTGNEDGEECTMNNPCEIDEEGNVFFEKGTSYGQQTSWVYTCLTEDLQIDLDLEGCKLAKPKN